jgi:paraquat-inducible protein B
MAPEKFTIIGLEGSLTKEEDKFLMGTLVSQGLRASLETESLVTGQKAVSLQFDPDTPAKLVGAHKEFAEIPTIATGFDKFTQKLEDLRLRTLVNTAIKTMEDVDKAINNFAKVARDVDAQIAPVANSMKTAFNQATMTLGSINNEVPPIATKAKDLLDESKGVVKDVGDKVGGAADGIGKLAGDIDRHVDPLAKQIQDALGTAQSALSEAKRAFANTRASTEPNSPLRYKVESALTDISAASRSIRALADLLERKPSSLLAGRGDAGKIYVLTSMPKFMGSIRTHPAVQNMDIAVGPIELAYHLNRPQIVTGSKGSEVRVNTAGSWAGELRENFTRTLQENLSTILSSEKIYAFPSDAGQKVDLRVKLMVDRIEAQPQSKGILSVTWSIHDNRNNKVLLSRKSRFEEKAGSLEFEGAVTALSQSIAKLSVEIANGIHSVAQKSR